MDLTAFACRLDGCGGPRSGLCINSLPFDDCPDVVPIPVDEEGGGDAGAASSAPIEMMSTRGGQSLDVAACDILLRERGGTMVGIVAGPEAGKTTLIGTMYELIHRGRMPGVAFAGSETLRGYEERTFLARIASNRPKPDTPRTKFETHLNFTHLRLKTKNGIRDVYFSDRSGEHFDRALGKPAEFGNFVELQRADTILLFVDLERLILSPQPVMSYVRRLVLAMSQNGLLAGKPLTFVGTKADLLTSATDQEVAAARLEALKESLRPRSTAADLRSFIVASRAPKGTNNAGVGLDQLLADILAKPAPPPFGLGNSAPRTPSELDALMDVFWRKSQ